MSLRTMLELAIEDGFNKLDKMEVGSDEYKSTVEQLTKMSDRLIEVDKLSLEEETQKSDKDLRERQMKLDQLDRWIKHTLTGVNILGGFALVIWGARASWKFEETGTYTSMPGRKFINSLLSWK